MSRKSKITLMLSSFFTVASVIYVHKVQDLEQQTLREGPIKDAKRIAKKLEERSKSAEISIDPEKERALMLNRTQHEQQLALRKKYEQLQPMSSKVFTKDGEVVSFSSE